MLHRKTWINVADSYAQRFAFKPEVLFDALLLLDRALAADLQVGVVRG